MRDAIETRSSAALADVVVAVKRCGALDRTRRDAEVQAQRAIDLLDALPSGEYRDALAELARFCVCALQLIESDVRSMSRVCVGFGRVPH